METPIDFGRRRMLMVEGSDNALITLTAAEDLVKIVVKAIEYEGKWPLVGGIRGNQIAIRDLIELGERVRGEPFQLSWTCAKF
jgi:hypothetical protein